jgi:hypothetical protein
MAAANFGYKENTMPVYAITNKTNNTTRLVLANNPAQALRHVAGDTFKTEVASSVLVGKLMNEGAKMEQAGAEQPGTE